MHRCQTSKVARHIRTPLRQFELPHRRFDDINVDLVGPLPPSQGFGYLLTIVDWFTRWLEAIPLADVSSITCARAFLFHWVSRFGLPINISSDREIQFILTCGQRWLNFWAPSCTAQLLIIHKLTALLSVSTGILKQHLGPA